MSRYQVAVVGTGPDPHEPTVESFAMGYRHAEAVANSDLGEVVACADIERANAEAFAEAFDLSADRVFEDYGEMLTAVEPDVVSVCTPPNVHEEIVVDCAESEHVLAVHCEKPMAHTLASARRMTAACEREGVQLTFNRQRRFGKPFRETKRLVEDGAVGDLRRVEITWGDFFDTGAHTVDLAGMFNGDRPAEWVIAQLDYREADLRFGMHQENQMWALWQYENGVQGVMSTGPGSDLCDASVRVAGTDGEIRIDADTGNMLEVRRAGESEWEPVDVDGEGLHGSGATDRRYGKEYQDRAMADVLGALAEGRESGLRAENGLKTAEILFGGYESVRRRGRVEFPVDVSDNPLEAMVEAGDVGPGTSGD